MRIPKEVTIGGKKYSVKRDKSLSEGCGSANPMTRVMMVGSKNGLPGIAFETFIHEIMEASLIENNFRYHREGYPGDFTYNMSHAEFCRFADDVACAIRPMLKGNE